MVTDEKSKVNEKEELGFQPSFPAPLSSITETSSVIDRADAAAKRMEDANKRAEEILIRQEAIAARLMLGGKSEAGFELKKETDEEKLNKEIKEYFEKTGLDPFKK